MSTRSKRRGRKPVRIETERSQAYSTPAKAHKLGKQHQRERDLQNRIFELEQQIASLSRGDRGAALELYVGPAVSDVIKRLTKTGFYGKTEVETASELLTAKVRSEMGWLATGMVSP